MKKQSARSRWLLPVLGGALCAGLTALAVWDALAHHGGRLVYPMDSYAFQTSDIPMLLALALDVLYVVYLLVLLIGAASRQKRQAAKTNRTRQISPKLGLLGFLGFFGFAGFWSYGAIGDLTPFCFFTFFGFFGFYFDGKMSNVLMDERYKENTARAQRTAYSTGMTIIFLLLVTACHGSAEVTAAILIAGVSLSLGLTLFLSSYLLYRYDHDDAEALEEEEDA